MTPSFGCVCIFSFMTCRSLDVRIFLVVVVYFLVGIYSFKSVFFSCDDTYFFVYLVRRLLFSCVGVYFLVCGCVFLSYAGVYERV